MSEREVYRVERNGPVGYSSSAELVETPPYAVCSVWLFWDSSQRSASIAAMQPEPAAVIACRYVWSWTSPQANTPGMLV